jgi:two-component system, OmpR family, alkaline phosphatase synthesis response regulator PhoP
MISFNRRRRDFWVYRIENFRTIELVIKTDINTAEISVLLADGNIENTEFLKSDLIEKGYKIITANNDKDALAKLSLKPDLVIVDAFIPFIGGYEICRKIRRKEEFRNIPVILLTDDYSEIDEVRAFNVGANDFLLKPISVNKISARIRSNLRKINRHYEPRNFSFDIIAGPLVINREEYTVSLHGAMLKLQKKEFELLYYLASNPGTVFNRTHLLENVWENNIFVMERTIDVHLLNIRKKLGKYSSLIETIKGVGYRFNDGLN